jgi:hypothetical protein
VAESGAQGQELEGLLKAAQGDVEGLGVFGLAEEAVQADPQEVQFVQFSGELGLVVLVVLGLEGPAEMLGVAGKGRGGEAVHGRQGAQGHATHQGVVDLFLRWVVADGTEAGPGDKVLRIFYRHVGHSSRFNELMVPC